MASFRGRWDCPACAEFKLANLTSHIVAKHSTLCWGPYSTSKRKYANVRGLGNFTIKFDGGSGVMVAESHIYEPNQPSLIVMQDVRDHVLQFDISRLDWSDKWRPPKGDAGRYETFDTKTLSLPAIRAALDQIGCGDGHMGKRSIDEVISTVEQILNGVSNFGSD